MKVRINEALRTISVSMFRNVQQSFESRRQKCIDVAGGYFETDIFSDQIF